jgi:hypothetical protein
MATRWAGIDEAGYGPNFGPLVMTCVVAESPDDRPPDLWRDLGSAVSRAGGDPAALWVDDSKAIYRGGVGLDRLEAASVALLSAVRGAVPASLGALLETLQAGTLDDAELTPWLEAGDPHWPRALDHSASHAAFSGPPWRLVSVRSAVIGPARFNRVMGPGQGGSKARVHQNAFAQLLRPLWEEGSATDTRIRSDKHGGRHFYHQLLSEIFPGTWIDRGSEGPNFSHYTVRDATRRLEVQFEPRADASDGLVALASMVSKTVREVWMDVFNAYWTSRIPGLRPTAGYPLDAARFRKAIEVDCLARGLGPEVWWRSK